MLNALSWDEHQTAVRLPDTTAAPTRQTWQIGDTGRVFTVHGSHAFPRYPMYDVYETTGGTPVTPAARIAQVHSLMRARLMIAKLARPAFAANWSACETALVIGEGIDLATAPVTERGTWTFTFDIALDTEQEGYEYTADGTLLHAAFRAVADFCADQEITDPDTHETGILGVVLAGYTRP
ncbi:hypothetical protein ACFVUW_28670 [Streptomyces xiamenensis]|uniref:hypothetical protein n=1 Tax=Streptomyces xiamenensis TaxID=408015 RepID=UPI0036EE2634